MQAVSQIIVPFMAVICRASVLLIICNITEIPAAIVTVVKATFNPSAVTGGVVGSMMFTQCRKGVAEESSVQAGLGGAPIAWQQHRQRAGTRQGLVSMTGTFIDDHYLYYDRSFHCPDRCMAGRGIEGVHSHMHSRTDFRFRRN